MCTEDFLQVLLRHGVFKTEDIDITRLAGGVSSEIYKIRENSRTFVVKRALAKLQVKEDWYADISRNHTEQVFIKYVAAFRPDAVPNIIYSSRKDGFFVMEYLQDFRNWKEDLLLGIYNTALAYDVGSLLGEIHNHSWRDAGAAKMFDTLKNFDQLRLDPYLRWTAQRNSPLRAQLLKEVDRLSGTRQCLVHGDFSPKNILHLDDRMVVIDCEVAWYGDPAFDLSFLLTHLLLKSIYQQHNKASTNKLVEAIRFGYREKNDAYYEEVESRCRILLPMILLARLDGKSPVEYLEHEKKRLFIRKFATNHIENPTSSMDSLCNNWFEDLSYFNKY